MSLRCLPQPNGLLRDVTKYSAQDAADRGLPLRRSMAGGIVDSRQGATGDNSTSVASKSYLPAGAPEVQGTSSL